MDTVQLDQILDKLARDVESSIHAFYRGDVRQHTQKVKTDTFKNAAKQQLVALLEAGDAAVSTSPQGGGAMTPDEIAAATKCVMAWMPMGAPNTMPVDSRCVPGAREMAPTWGERERARQALRRSAG